MGNVSYGVKGLVYVTRVIGHKCPQLKVFDAVIGREMEAPDGWWVFRRVVGGREEDVSGGRLDWCCVGFYV